MNGVYPYHAALVAIDQHAVGIMTCLAFTVLGAFYYFFVALRLSFRQKVYVVPFIPNVIFFWHDLSFVLSYDLWFNVYDHWWLKMWWFALCGTVLLEIVMIWLVYKFGHEELWPNFSRTMFGWLIILGTLGGGAFWYLIKTAMGDGLFFITFAITASLSVPFHTVLMSRRQSRAGQSITMELATMVMLGCEALAFVQVDPFFRSAPFLLFVAALMIWPLANIFLMTRFPRLPKPSAA